MASSQPKCLVCDRNTDQIPLLAMRYHNSDLWICPQHLPILIHKPHELADRLPHLDLADPPDVHHNDH